MPNEINLQAAQLADAHPLPQALNAISVGTNLYALQNGTVAGTAAGQGYGFKANVIQAAAIRYNHVTGTIATAGTAVNTGAVGAGITPILYWVASGPEGAAIASYSGGADGTFSVNASATGSVVVQFIY